MITLNKKKTCNKNKIFDTNIILKNRFELLQNKNKIISIKKNIQKIHLNEKKIRLTSENFFYQSKMLKNEKNEIILKKIQEIDPWYREIYKLKNLPKIVQKLAIHTSYKNTLKYWYVFLNKKNKDLIKYDAWIIFKKELSTITEKKIKLIIKKTKILNILTPYEWFKKIYKERTLKEYLLLIKDPNIQFFKKNFNAKLNRKNVNFISVL
ncbi:DNA polymerase III subunit gamma/tau C-terminal domain-containing protein [Buchnera aphidicola]|uniref:DNA polymerase III subunit gamma/tau C-terminal domain-containing protein n=1 Tax=Buchnera aphidicola TaxID=9 RepID=UPI0004BA2E00|nr:DNA polymerase III subunit gamma/tau C-terminal domain-containing protein [Buchnera aphidicola]WAI02846.1 MAG: hypothetical protein OW722_01555 [Buchnera aphidicola (Myzus persicae)]